MTMGNQPSPARHVTQPGQPNPASFMINYRVDSLDGMLAQLKAKRIKPVKGPESAENGNSN